MSWHGQFAEDCTIAQLLGDRRDRAEGWYVDVGANCPHVHSVTKYFYDRGWCGVNVEPVLYWHKQLVTNRQRDVNLRCAAGEKAEDARTIYVAAGTGLSTLVDGTDFGDYETYTETVAVRTLADICEEFPPPDDRFFGFLKIDVEAHEAAVLRGADFERFRPIVICAEADKVAPDGQPLFVEWEPLLTAAGYRFAHADWVNRFYVDRSQEA